jgi:hypothetical protein
MQVRSLPDVKVLTDFGAYGVGLPPNHQLEVQVEVTPRSYGIICTLLMLDFGKCRRDLVVCMYYLCGQYTVWGSRYPLRWGLNPGVGGVVSRGCGQQGVCSASLFRTQDDPLGQQLVNIAPMAMQFVLSVGIAHVYKPPT